MTEGEKKYLVTELLSLPPSKLAVLPPPSSEGGKDYCKITGEATRQVPMRRGARVSGGHLCEYNEQKRCPSRQASNACSRRMITCKLTAGAYVSSIDYLQNVRDDCLHI